MIALALFCTAVVLVGAYRRLALRYHWLDIPNERSLHRQTVPRGAGAVIALLVGVAAAATTSPVFFTALLPGLGLAVIGWWDDLRGLSARFRFLAYGGCAFAALLLLPGGVGPTNLIDWIWLVLGTIGLLWVINLYNFMDGINGIATLEAIFIVAGGVALSANLPGMPPLEAFNLCILAILVGFLGWNFPRARVFMGDVGSAFLGFLLGLIAIWSHRHGGPSLAVWSILGAAFVADSSYTLLVRLATGQRWYEAHRLHAFQKLTSRWHESHVKTTAAFAGVNLAWLLPLAWLTHHQLLAAWLAILLAYLPLVAVCYVLKAGIPQVTRV